MLGVEALFVGQLWRDGVAEQGEEHEIIVVEQTAFQFRLVESRLHLVITLNLLLFAASFMNIISSKLRW